MATAVLIAPKEFAIDTSETLTRALDVVTKKVGISEDEILRRLHARDRMTWSRLRFELAREISKVLTGRVGQIRSVHLWELDEEHPEDMDAPAETTLDLIVRVDRIPAGLDDLAVSIGQGLAEAFAIRAPGTPLVLNVHVLSRTMMNSGRGMAALFRSDHQRPALIWSADK